MSNAAFDDRLDAFTAVESSSGRAAIAELASIEREVARLEGRRIQLLSVLAALADRQAARSCRPHARDYARRSLAAEAAPSMRVSPADARAELAKAELLAGMCPRTLDALVDGRLTRRHAEHVAHAASSLDAGARASLDAHAAELAVGRTARQFGRLVRKRAAELDSRSLKERHDCERSRRRVTIADLGDGMSELRLVGPTVETRAVFSRLTEMARTIHNDRRRAATAYEKLHAVAPVDGWTAPETRAAGVEATDPLTIAATDHRTIGQIRVDLLLEMLLSGAPTAQQLVMNGTGAALRDIRAVVQVTVPIDQLIDPHEGAGWIDDGTLASPDTLRILAGTAEGWDRVFIRRDTGDVEATDRYRPTTEQRRMLLARDMSCRIPGCEKPGHACDLDHGRAHALGGKTSVDNLEALCPGHHQMKHQAGWGVRQKPGGVIEFTTPLGQTLTDDPLSRVFFRTASDEAATRAAAVLRRTHDVDDALLRQHERFEEDDDRARRDAVRRAHRRPPGADRRRSA